MMKLNRAIFPVLCAGLALSLLAQAAEARQEAIVHTQGYADIQSCEPVRPENGTRNQHARTVHFAFLIGPDGTVRQSKITKSSGYKDLDEAALVAFQKCTFHPATAQNRPQISWVMLSYKWRRVDDHSRG